jgi:hypothetical protein
VRKLLFVFILLIFFPGQAFGGTSKILPPVYSDLFYKPEDFRTISSNSTVATLTDSVGAKHELKFINVDTTLDKSKLSFHLRIKVDKPAIADRFVKVEAFVNQDNTLKSFDENEIQYMLDLEYRLLPTTYEISKLKNVKTLYFRVSVKKEKTSTTYDSTMFKIDIPSNLLDVTPIEVDKNVGYVHPVTDADEVVIGIGHPNGEVEIEIEGKKQLERIKLAKGKAGEDGKFSIAIPKQKQGTALLVSVLHPVTKSGKVIRVVVGDGTAPGDPTIFPINNKDTTITGTAGEGRVFVKAGDEELGWNYVNGAGKYSIQIKPQPAGTVLTVWAVDQFDNKSKEVSIVVGKAAPSKPYVANVNNMDIFVIGTTDANCVVTVKIGSKVIGKGKSDGEGNFQVKILKQKAGSTLSVLAEDGLKQVSPAFSVKVSAVPGQPVVNPVGDQDLVVSGKAKAGAELRVVVMLGEKVLGEGDVDGKGCFSVKLPSRVKVGTALSFYAIDSMDNKSGVVKVKVLATPKAPVVDGLNSKSVMISGKAEKSGTVFVYAGAKLVGKVSVSKSGSFRGNIAVQKKGVKLRVYVVSGAGVKSKDAVVTVR